MTQLSHNNTKNLPLLSNCWWQHRFQQGLKDLLQTLDYWHGFNSICRSKVEISEKTKQKTLSSCVNKYVCMVYVKNCPWLVLYTVYMPKGTVRSRERKCIGLKLKITMVEGGLQVHVVIYEARSWSKDLKEPRSVLLYLTCTNGSIIPSFWQNFAVCHQFWLFSLLNSSSLCPCIICCLFIVYVLYICCKHIIYFSKSSSLDAPNNFFLCLVCMCIRSWV